MWINNRLYFSVAAAKSILLFNRAHKVVYSKNQIMVPCPRRTCNLNTMQKRHHWKRCCAEEKRDSSVSLLKYKLSTA